MLDFFSNAFSVSKEMIMCFFVFEVVYIVDYVDGFPYIEPSLHPWMKPTWSGWMIALMCSWIRLGRTLLRIFASIFITEIGLKFSFFVGCLCGLPDF